MERQASLADVLRTLQSILSSPDTAASQYLSAYRDTGKQFPVLPQSIPRLPVPNIEQSLPLESQEESSVSDLATHLTSTILPYLNLASLSPNYYGFVTGGATPAALLGDILASIFDQNVQVHLPKETLATTLEVVTLNLLTQLFRLPEADWAVGRKDFNGGATFTTGATASNVLGLALGREFVVRKALQRKAQSASLSDGGSSLSCGENGLAESMLRAGVTKIQVLSTLPHSSIAKAASIVGIGRRHVVSIATAHDPLHIDIARLKQETSKKDVLNILVMSAGEVNTGRFATNSLAQWTSIRQICDAKGVWIHVDGAFGLFGRVFSATDAEYTGYTRIVEGVDGLDLADSITGDCHKLLNVPYDSGAFFTRHKSLLQDVFKNGNAAYLTSGAAPGPVAVADGDYDAIQSPLNIGIENSRRFRALPVYATLVAYGRSGYADMLKRQITLARRVTAWLLRDDRFEVLPSRAEGESEDELLAQTFIVVLFRVRDDEVMKGFVKNVNGTGKMYLTGTVWEGKAAARIAVSNWQVDVRRDLEVIVDVLNRAVG
jgi:glutamate/tyrosine decarboxylase-like PLP-dependent enzyme